MSLPLEESTCRRLGSDNSLVVRRDTYLRELYGSRGEATVDTPAEEPQNKGAGNRSAGNRLAVCAVEEIRINMAPSSTGPAKTDRDS